jgi:hypothetical protein
MVSMAGAPGCVGSQRRLHMSDKWRIRSAIGRITTWTWTLTKQHYETALVDASIENIVRAQPVIFEAVQTHGDIANTAHQ